MVESSKILTVSYGTFSCTLEGFDDSFSTMKAIAEYFRDLAQGDRYFGAEPPAPDAEMLTRIAEQEIDRRVEARADDSGIVLRATEIDHAPAAVAVMPPVATPPSAEEVAEVDAPAIEEIEETTQAATADMDGDVAGSEAGEDSPTLVVSSPATPDTAEDATEEMDVTAPATSFADMDTIQIADTPAQPEVESVAAKLQRIRAVVGTPAPEADEASAEDETAEAVEETAITEDVAEDNLADEDENDFAEESTTSGTFEIDVAEEPADDMAEVSEDDADVAEDAVEAVEAEDAVEAAEDVAETEEAEAEEAPKQNFRARILRVAKKPIAPILEDEAGEDTSDDSAADTAENVRESIAAQMGEDTVAEEEENVFDDLGDDDQNDAASDDQATDGSLSEEDEAELMADLAEVEREFEEPEVAEAPESTDEDTPAAAEDSAPSGRDALPKADDAAMSRIMDQADEQLSEPEGSRRRSAIAQLKAAVAATEAARQLGDSADDAASKENAFRDDLNEAVHPRHASELPRTEARTERPRPAPLKLVASQRVGEDGEEDQAEEASVQPRRVASDAAADAGSFSDFAADMGATELPDLLEAAAAYTAYVEGVEDFSRPQIMKKVQASSAQEFSREDGLRSFGTLLRQGRISKVRNGRFQVSDQTRFKPEKKAG